MLTISEVPFHQETIICPECETVQVATVAHTLPWWSYIHNCSSCGFIIMESEWEKHPTVVISAPEPGILLFDPVQPSSVNPPIV